MAINKQMLDRFNRLNTVAKSNGAVFFGSDFFTELPLNELASDFGVSAPVYNRSVSGLSIYEAESVLRDCIYELDPAKIFINIGDADLAQGMTDTKRFLEAYEWLLYTIHRNSRVKIYIVSICSSDPLANVINRGLKKIAENTGCTYVDIDRALSSDNREVQSFKQMKFFLRDKPFTFADAF